jgi:hypothetical protein
MVDSTLILIDAFFLLANRQCHTAVHNVATNEELAQHYYTVELLLQREDIQKWGRYASKQRFGIRRR